MTGTDARGLHSCEPTDEESAVRSKRVLFCPKCDHDGPIGAAWLIRPAADVDERTSIVCPDCETVVARR